MEWSPQQDAALQDVGRWLADPTAPQVYYLAGFAGTGKTTLAKHLAEGVDGQVLFGAYTGKAALVLRQKGCPATTIHSMIYRAKSLSREKVKALEAAILQERHTLRLEQGPEGELRKSKQLVTLEEQLQAEKAHSGNPLFDLNTDSEVAEAALVVIDECSMVDGQMGEDLLSFGTKVLVLGDPAQLPPVMGGGFFTERRPNMVLTEVHRQAKDSPIIWLATKVRNEESLAPGVYGDSKVVAKGVRLDPEEVLKADQVIVGKNVTRSATNARFRSLLNGKALLEDSVLPVAGDRLVCLRNNHELGLLNGGLWRCDASQALNTDRVIMTVSSTDMDGRDPIDLEAHTHYFVGASERLAWWERTEAEEFDYAYALTCHKAQGSQFNDVLVFNEGYCFRQDRYKWLYTAITRAATRTTVAQM